MKHLCLALLALCGPLTLPVSTVAEEANVNALRAQVMDAEIAKKVFAAGSQFCNVLDGKRFYLASQRRVLNLDEFFESLQHLVKDQSFNREKQRPWSAEDAKEKWEWAQKSAARDKANCEKIANLPALQKQLADLQAKPN